MEQQKYTRKCLDASFTAPAIPHLPEELPPELMEQRDPKQVISETLELLHRLPPVLQGMLDAELKARNKVSSAMLNYPDPGSICVTLSKRFQIKHKPGAQAKYTLCNDPHYWYADYSTVGMPRHVLIS